MPTETVLVTGASSGIGAELAGLFAADGSPRMVDFGFSRFVKDGERAETIAGSLEYLAPEMEAERPYRYGVDWWCLGIFVYKMTTGKTRTKKLKPRFSEAKPPKTKSIPSLA